jgi:hypothetical protein
VVLMCVPSTEGSRDYINPRVITLSPISFYMLLLFVLYSATCYHFLFYIQPRVITIHLRVFTFFLHSATCYHFLFYIQPHVITFCSIFSHVLLLFVLHSVTCYHFLFFIQQRVITLCSIFNQL